MDLIDLLAGDHVATEQLKKQVTRNHRTRYFDECVAGRDIRLWQDGAGLCRLVLAE